LASRRQGGLGLGACWGEEKARALLVEAGFSTVAVERVEGDPVNARHSSSAPTADPKSPSSR
jgi:hypothetical protein